MKIRRIRIIGLKQGETLVEGMANRDRIAVLFRSTTPVRRSRLTKRSFRRAIVRLRQDNIWLFAKGNGPGLCVVSGITSFGWRVCQLSP